MVVAQGRLPLTASWEACATRRRSSGSFRESGNHFSIPQEGAGPGFFAGTTLRMRSTIESRSAVARRPHRFGMMIGQLFLVLAHLLVDLVDQRVDGGVHVRGGCDGVQLAAGFLGS